jgi:phage major head subunit gpT-like protein
MILKANIGDTLEPGFLEIFLDNYKETERIYTSLFNVKSSMKQDERISAFTGFGYPVPKSENAPISYEDPVQMYDTVFTHITYAKGFKVSRESLDDDQYNIISRMPALLGKSMRRWEENSGSLVVARAFNQSYLGGDAKSLASTVHPRSDGGSSQSNASATGLTLTEANYETARLAMRNQLDDKGMKVDVMPNKLYVPIALEKTARILFESNLRAGTADNDLNFYKGTLQIVPWIYLDNISTTAWYLCDTDQANFMWFWRDKAEFKNDTSFETDAYLYKARERFTNGFGDWRGFWASKGDGAAYAS